MDFIGYTNIKVFIMNLKRILFNISLHMYKKGILYFNIFSFEPFIKFNNINIINVNIIKINKLLTE